MKPTLTLHLVMVEDEKLGGFTAFFKEFSNVIVEGEDEHSAIEKLTQCLKDVLQYENKNTSVGSPAKVIERTVQFEAIA